MSLSNLNHSLFSGKFSIKIEMSDRFSSIKKLSALLNSYFSTLLNIKNHVPLIQFLHNYKGESLVFRGYF